MANDDVDDIFKDFEHKITGKEPDYSEKEETSEHHKNMGTPEKGLSEEEHLKRKYERAEQVLKHKYKKEKEALAKKKEEELPPHAEHSGHPANRHSTNLERVAYIAIIIVLVVYIAFSFGRGGNVAVETDQTITAAAVKTEDTTEEIEEGVLEEVVEEEPVEEEKILSGKITFTLDKVYTEVPNEDNDFGYISKVIFTIDNGKDKALTPVVDVFVYDSELGEIWETKSRGRYSGIAINSGDKQTGSISLVPKSFTNLDINKHLRLVLNNTEDNTIKAINKEVLIS